MKGPTGSKICFKSVFSGEKTSKVSPFTTNSIQLIPYEAMMLCHGQLPGSSAMIGNVSHAPQWQ